VRYSELEQRLVSKQDYLIKEEASEEIRHAISIDRKNGH
jgi:hypothetical protein